MSRYFREVLYASGELRQDMIRSPSNETPHKISNSSRWYPYFMVINLTYNVQVIAACLSAYLVTNKFWVVM
jgi:hypothetical protein